MDEDRPFAYVARPHYERDEVRVYPDLETLVARCDEGRTMAGPDAVRVMAAYRDGREDEVSREAYSAPEPVSRKDAEEFIRWRSEPGASEVRKLVGCLRSNPDLPFEEQVKEYIENPPWRWKTAEEVAAGVIGT